MDKKETKIEKLQYTLSSLNKNKKELLKGEKLVDVELDKQIAAQTNKMGGKQTKSGSNSGLTVGEDLKSTNKQTIIKDMVKKLHTDLEKIEVATSNSSQTFASTTSDGEKDYKSEKDYKTTGATRLNVGSDLSEVNSEKKLQPVGKLLREVNLKKQKQEQEKVK